MYTFFTKSCANLQVPFGQEYIFLISAPPIDTKTNFEPKPCMHSYRIITLDSVANFCGFWAPDLKRTYQGHETGTGTRKTLQHHRTMQKNLVHDLGDRSPPPFSGENPC